MFASYLPSSQYANSYGQSPQYGASNAYGYGQNVAQQYGNAYGAPGASYATQVYTAPVTINIVMDSLLAPLKNLLGGHGNGYGQPQYGQQGMNSGYGNPYGDASTNPLASLMNALGLGSPLGGGAYGASPYGGSPLGNYGQTMGQPYGQVPSQAYNNPLASLMGGLPSMGYGMPSYGASPYGAMPQQAYNSYAQPSYGSYQPAGSAYGNGYGMGGGDMSSLFSTLLSSLQQPAYSGYSQPSSYGGQSYHQPYCCPPQVEYVPVPVPVPVYPNCQYDYPEYPQEPVDYPTKASANLSGDPTLRLNSLVDSDGNHLTLPSILTDGIDVLPETGKSINLLSDESNDLSLDAVYHDINGAAAKGVAMKESTISVGKYEVQTQALDDGDMLITVLEGGDAVHWQGKLSDGADSFEIDGIKVGFANRPDGVDDDGNVVEDLRAFIDSGEYEFTFAVRKPHADTKAYLDANVEELTAHAADDATNEFTVDVDVDGETVAMGLADVLNLGEGNNENAALLQQLLDASA